MDGVRIAAGDVPSLPASHRPRPRRCRMNRRLRLAWAAVALLAAVVVPLRIAEIQQAHSDRDAAKARWALSTSVRG